MQTLEWEFEGNAVTVIRPERPCGKWIWKTEFLYAFDEAERALCDRGYTRVYYKISNRYGSDRAVRMMRAFHAHVVKKFDLEEKCVLFGFSRGGLYAFNFALFYPELVDKIYLDAPVLDLRTWPPEGTKERAQVYEEFGLTAEALEIFRGHPIENLEEFFALGIPLLLVAGGADEVVPFPQNAGRMIDWCREHGVEITSIVKPDCRHHPHSLEDVTPILNFVQK